MNALTLRIVVILSSGLLSNACAVTTVEQPAQTHSGNALALATASSPSVEQVLQSLSGERLIYVGETHTRYADHMLQLSALRALPADQVALGVEWFQARFQPALDAYLDGSIDEAEMLRRTEYFDRWGFDYRLYRPIIQYARANRIPIVALNASRELVNAIRESGFKGLSEEMKAELPDGYDFNDKRYEQLLQKVFAQHNRDDQGFERFRDIQLTWDETMAQNIARYLQQHPDKRMLVLAGRGHIGGRHGIPQRVTRRIGERGVILASYAPGLPPRDQADYLVLDEDQPLPAKGLMGALLDIDADRIRIKDFTPGSAAEAAGVRSDDRIAAVDGEPTTDLTRFKLQMMDKRPGERITLGVIRKGLFGREKELSFEFELKGASQPGMRHPDR